MTRGAAALALLLSYAIVTIWMDARWPWATFQFAVFAWIAGWSLWQIWRPSRLQLTIWIVPLAAVPAWAVIQAVSRNTIYRTGTLTAALTWATWLTLFILGLQLFETHAARHWILGFAVYFGFGLSIVSTLQMFTSHGEVFWLFPSGFTDSVMGPFTNRNQYAAFLEMILPIALWHALRDPRRRLAYGAMAAAMMASVIASASRAGTLLVVAETMAVLLLAWRRAELPRRVIAGSFAAICMFAVLFSGIVSWQALERRIRDSDPFAHRREFVESSLLMLRERPMMGFGLGNWARAYPGYALFDDGTVVNQAHNDWLQWAVEGGVPLLLTLLSVAVMVTPAALRSIWGMGLLSVWLHCLVDYPLQQRPGIGAWFFVLLAALASSRCSAADQHASTLPLSSGRGRLGTQLLRRLRRGR